MVEAKCPKCSVSQKPHWCSNSWKYGKINVDRYECECGTNFNLYKSEKSTWTIPKGK
jgi:hypothetical protein